ncbi:MAG: calcium-binding protein, partial [Bauldia litoralis]
MATQVGTAASETIIVISASDVVYGLDGNDRLQSAFANTFWYGGQGNDLLFATTAGAYGDMYGGAGNDWLYSAGNTANDDMYGGEGNDV